jgi:DNA-binding NtrC family response regulator
MLAPEAGERLRHTCQARECPATGERDRKSQHDERRVLTAADFPFGFTPRLHSLQEPERGMGGVSAPDSGLDYEQTVANIERNLIAQALEKTGGNKKAAAAWNNVTACG